MELEIASSLTLNDLHYGTGGTDDDRLIAAQAHVRAPGHAPGARVRGVAPCYWVLMPMSLIIFAQNAFCSFMKAAKSSRESLVICWALTFS